MKKKTQQDNDKKPKIYVTIHKNKKNNKEKEIKNNKKNEIVKLQLSNNLNNLDTNIHRIHHHNQ